MPGFIDSHTHGAFGFSFDNDLENKELFLEYLKGMKNEGVIGIVGTSVTSSLDKLYNNLNSIKKIINHKEKDFPEILTWHFEGPFISKAKKGAHEEDLIILMDEQFLKMIKNKLNIKNIVLTIDSSEEQNKKMMVKYKNDFIFSLGHSNANYEQAKFAFNNGIKRVTHLYNAMSGFSHSGELGIINAIFNKEFKKNLCIELIADGVHVSNKVIKYTYDNIDINNICLITDSLSSKGLEDGFYKLGDLDIEKKGNWFYLKDKPNLAGSGIKFNWMLKYFMKITKCSWNDIVKVSSYNTARSLKLSNNYGDFVVGKKINFVLIDKKFNIKEVFI